MSDNDRQLKHDYIKIVLDKFLLALFFVVIGFFVNSFIETQKSKESFYNELNKMRVQKLSEVWEKAYMLEREIPKYKKIYERYDKKIKDYLKSMQQSISNGQNPMVAEKSFYKFEMEIENEMILEINSLDETHLKDLEILLLKNKFWLDKKSVETLNEYAEAVNELGKLKPLKEEKFNEKINNLISKINKLETRINDVKESIFNN